MRPVAVIVPGRIDTATGGYVYDRRVLDGLRERGWNATLVELPDTFPFPDHDTLAGAARAFAGIDEGTLTIVDGLAYGAMPEVVEQESRRLRFVPIVHLPLGEDVGLEAPVAERLSAQEARSLRSARGIIVTGRRTFETLAEDRALRDRLWLFEPGTDPRPLAHGSGSAVPHLLCVATVNRGKGYLVLVNALGRCADLPWRLTCVGSLTRDRREVQAVHQRVADLRLAERIEFVGEVAPGDMARWYDRADLFVLATLKETYGMAVAEALACGLPIVSTDTGAIPDLVGAGAGRVVAPGDVDALAHALADGLGSSTLRARFAEGARVVRTRLLSWNVVLDKMAATLDGLD